MKTSQEKINRIKETLAQTREKRKSQVCKNYTLKIDYSHTNKHQKEWLKRIFIEAKWFYHLPRKTASLQGVDIRG